MHDFGGSFNQIYTEECKGCGYLVKVSAQKDKHPEYKTDIFVKCRCGESVPFRLPVN